MKWMDALLGKMIDRRIAEYQSDLMKKHCEEVQNIYKTMRGWRHDYHNHIQTLLALCGDEQQTREYLWKLNRDLMTVDTVIKTGNVMVDAILNSKLSLMKSRGIEVNAKAIVPKELAVSEIDLCALIGNLLDNAMEAVLRQPEESEKFVRVFIGILKEQLYVSVYNSTGGEIRKSGKRYVSVKKEAHHGFGIDRIDRIVKKYNGFVNRQNEEGVFATEVLLPLPEVPFASEG